MMKTPRLSIADQPDHLVADLVSGPVEEHIDLFGTALRSCSTKRASW